MPTMATDDVDRMMSKRSRAVGLCHPVIAGSSLEGLDRGVECPFEIPDDVVGLLYSYGDSDQVGRYACSVERGVGQLPMGGASGVDDERLGVADVGEVTAQLQRFDERPATLAPADHAEREHGAWPKGQVSAGTFVVRVVGQARPPNPADCWVTGQRAGDGARVLQVGVHALWQSFDPLHQQEGIERRQRRADISQLLGTETGAE